MSHNVLDGQGNLKYVRSLGDGSASDPLRLVYFDHREADVDDGLVFSHSDRHTIANNDILYYLLVIPAAPAHIELHHFSVQSNSSPVYCDIYEGPTTSANGSVGPLHNNNRNMYNVSSLAVLYEGATVTSEGTHLSSSLTGGTKSAGDGGVDFSQRLIFKNSTNYLFKLENASGATATIAISLVIGED